MQFFKEKKGDWVSGESLADKLSISRSAIWKHVSILRAKGYIIESSPKKGYLLRESCSMLLPHEIREGLKTKVFGRETIHHFRVVESTNTKAREMAEGGAPEGTIIIAESQINGRGRKGREWFSPSESGIYVSLLLRPHIPPAAAPGITLMTACAVAETLHGLNLTRIHIKWPNDILVNDRKIAGILTEISSEMDSVNYIVVGLGLNVNTDAFPHGLKKKATSILLETGSPFSRVRLLRDYLQWFEKYYATFQKDGCDAIRKRWQTLTDIVGHRIRAEMIDNSILGTVQDIDRNGVLILKDHLGISHRIFSADVTLL